VQLIGNPNKNLSFDDYNTDRVRFSDIDTHIYDLRGKTAAFGNKFKGKGYESTLQYYNCEIYFEDIPNIHGVRDAFEPVADLADDAVENCLRRSQRAGILLLESRIGWES
jgi:hypothetical protein